MHNWDFGSQVLETGWSLSYLGKRHKVRVRRTQTSPGLRATDFWSFL